MKPGISVYSLIRSFRSGALDYAGILQYCADNGIRNVELLDVFFDESKERASRQYILNEIKRLGLAVSSYSISNDFVHCADVDAEISRVCAGVDAALQFGAKNVRVFSANPKEGVTYETCRQIIIDSFKKCVKYAEEKQVSLNLENHGKMAGKSSQVKDIIDAVGSKYLRATADTGNFLLVAENPLDAVKNLEGYVGFVHFKDFTVSDKGRYTGTDGKKYLGTAIGAGDVPLKEIIAALKSSGFDGHISVEYEGEGDDAADTASSFNFLRSLIGE